MGNFVLRRQKKVFFSISSRRLCSRHQNNFHIVSHAVYFILGTFFARRGCLQNAIFTVPHCVCVCVVSHVNVCLLFGKFRLEHRTLCVGAMVSANALAVHEPAS